MNGIARIAIMKFVVIFKYSLREANYWHYIVVVDVERMNENERVLKHAYCTMIPFATNFDAKSEP